MKDLKGLKIHCDTQEEKKELLEEATKQGFTLRNVGLKPLEPVWIMQANDLYFLENREFVHSCGKSDCISYKEYKASGFTKADLKPCMVVQFSDGVKAIVGMSIYGICIDFQNRSQCLYVKDFNDDLSFPDCDSCDIVKVFGYSERALDSTYINAKRDLIWEDNSVKISVSDAEKELNKLSGKKYKIVKE